MKKTIAKKDYFLRKPNLPTHDVTTTKVAVTESPAAEAAGLSEAQMKEYAALQGTSTTEEMLQISAASKARMISRWPSMVWGPGTCSGFGAVIEGKIFIPRLGKYKFHLCSKDGSKMYIDGETVIDNNGQHGYKCAKSVGTR